MQLTNERGNPVWLTYADFLVERSERKGAQWDMGQYWRGPEWLSTYHRVSWIDATGELYAVALEDSYDGAVELLAVVPTEEDVRELMDGWWSAIRLGSILDLDPGDPDTLDWVREQVEWYRAHRAAE